jgi:hypothetical protein
LERQTEERAERVMGDPRTARGIGRADGRKARRCSGGTVGGCAGGGAQTAARQVRRMIARSGGVAGLQDDDGEKVGG